MAMIPGIASAFLMAMPNLLNAKVIGQALDAELNANVFLYDTPCRLSRFSPRYPLAMDIRSANNDSLITEGCYSPNQQNNQVYVIVQNGNSMAIPMGHFQSQAPSGNQKNFFEQLADGIADMQQFSRPQPRTNLTGGTTQGNGTYNCTPDGRGGYNCR